MGGARILSFYPLSIVVHGVALNITVQSYDGKMDFGFIACRRAMPGVRDLAQHVQAAFDELQQLLAAKMHGTSAAPRKGKNGSKAAPGKRVGKKSAKVAAPRKAPAQKTSGKAPVKRTPKAIEKRP
jgi:hypothetical protein